MTSETIHETPLTEEMRTSFGEYALSVIVSRALPDVRDGMKPVHRRILFDLFEQGIRPGTSYKKCARVVGSVMGKYHPHGDSAIYEALVRLAQDFSLRIPLVDGHGNFGSLDDPAASARYTECRMGPAAMSMVGELSEDTVDFKPNYDGSEREPVVLPAAFPNLLVNGAAGIAVGMATNMAPHNLSEVTAGLVAMLRNPQITLDEVMGLIPGPDLPTGGLVLGREGIREAYETGRGVFRMRAVVSEEKSGRRSALVVSELPYGVGPEKVVTKVKELQAAKRLSGVASISDHSDRHHGLKLVIEVKAGYSPDEVKAELFRLTPLEESFGINNVALVEGKPQTLGLLALMRHFLDHRLVVVKRRTENRLMKAEARLHLVEGLLIALASIDEVVAVIKGSRDTEAAKKSLMSTFVLSEVQAAYILEMPLRRLTSLEVSKLRAEKKELLTAIKGFKSLLSSPAKMRTLVGEELLAQAEEFGTPRQSVISDEARSEAPARVKSEVADVPCTLFLSAAGVLSTSPGSDVFASVEGSERTYTGVVTSRGRMLRVVGRDVSAKGLALADLTEVEAGESAVAVIALDRDVFLATRSGLVKRVAAKDLPSRSGSALLALSESDVLVGCVQPSEEDDVVLVSRSGQCLRTSVAAIRPQGRSAAGVAGMKGEVIFLGVYDEEGVLASVSDAGKMKVSALSEYPAKGRGGAGVRCQSFNKGESELSAAWAGRRGVSVSAKGTSPLPPTLSRRDASGSIPVGEVVLSGA